MATSKVLHTFAFAAEAKAGSRDLYTSEGERFRLAAPIGAASGNASKRAGLP
jgi:hypothetical protein